jgi:membrane peptidoglycan carboxypeptidase
VLSVDDADGHRLFTYDPTRNATKVVSEQVAFIMSDILSNNANRQMEFGYYNPLELDGHTAAAKTGTTTDFRDNLTIGWTPTLVTAVWVGNADNSPMINSTGITGAAPIWHEFMTQALADQPDQWYGPPEGLDPGAGGAYFIPGTENAGQMCGYAPRPQQSFFPGPGAAPPAHDHGHGGGGGGDGG